MLKYKCLSMYDLSTLTDCSHTLCCTLLQLCGCIQNYTVLMFSPVYYSTVESQQCGGTLWGYTVGVH